MAFAHPALAPPLFEFLFVGGKSALRPAAQTGALFFDGCIRQPGVDLVEILEHLAANHVGTAETVVQWRFGGLLVEFGDAARDLVDMLRGKLAPFGHTVHPGLGGELPHFDGILQQWPFPFERWRLGITVDAHYAEVEFGCQPPVEPEFLLAEMASFLQGAEIQEAQVHRLLELVRIVPGEEDVGYVGLYDLDVRDGMGIGRGGLEAFHQAGEFVSFHRPVS